jgi:hypothetical protein
MEFVEKVKDDPLGRHFGIPLVFIFIRLMVGIFLTVLSTHTHTVRSNHRV